MMVGRQWVEVGQGVGTRIGLPKAPRTQTRGWGPQPCYTEATEGCDRPTNKQTDKLSALYSKISNNTSIRLWDCGVCAGILRTVLSSGTGVPRLVWPLRQLNYHPPCFHDHTYTLQSSESSAHLTPIQSCAVRRTYWLQALRKSVHDLTQCAAHGGQRATSTGLFTWAPADLMALHERTTNETTASVHSQTVSMDCFIP